ncbi:hypothetical protein JYK02_13570 [Corallococcus macrosporus]|uniref:RiboL-PSP-HEPN domain-containing protein n=1 Tax=Corallococcus macrosporus TaxID=35 RepID=A0ABS3DDN6_9BACT|nr:hypothetical protein [Corallococcus macrosporus]MBN8228535.1 hypothetical protein [Corallococcus macrosporus]
MAEIVGHLGSSLENLVDEVDALGAETDASATRRAVLYGPFLGRSIMEVALTALIARLDPFRVLTLRKIQLQSSYSKHRRTRAAIQWTGDVMAEEKIDKLWTGERDFAGMTRALLGDYQDHVFWQPAFERFLDSVPEERGGEWVRTLRRVQPENFVASMRTRFGNAFSECSKGVHHELVIPSQNFFTRETVFELLQRVLEITAVISSVFNMCDHVAFCVGTDEVLAALEQMQQGANLDGVGGQ